MAKTTQKPNSSRHSGLAFEHQALRFLKTKGLRLIEKNYHCRGGEIDLIMKEQDTLVFVEVRYRKSSRYGSAAESVTPQKQQKIIHCAQFYLQTNPALRAMQPRFDVIAISPTGKPHGNLDFHWYRNAFQ